MSTVVEVERSVTGGRIDRVIVGKLCCGEVVIPVVMVGGDIGT